jgi:hypothetical protein
MAKALIDEIARGVAGGVRLWREHYLTGSRTAVIRRCGRGGIDQLELGFILWDWMCERDMVGDIVGDAAKLEVAPCVLSEAMTIALLSGDEFVALEALLHEDVRLVRKRLHTREPGTFDPLTIFFNGRTPVLDPATLEDNLDDWVWDLLSDGECLAEIEFDHVPRITLSEAANGAGAVVASDLSGGFRLFLVRGVVSGGPSMPLRRIVNDYYGE